MKAYHIGFFIKKCREEKNISQKELCRGVCDVSTLSRIERGKHEPSVSTLKVLIQRLGLDDDQFYTLLGPQDFEINNLQREIVSLNSQHHFEQAAEKLEHLEKIANRDDKVIQQFILRSKAVLLPKEDYSAQRELLTSALCITYPDFDFDNISKYLLSIDEVKILNQIAVTYSETGNRRFAINIYRQLIESPFNKAVSDETKASVTPLLAYNYSRLLGREKRYEEELEIAQMGEDICIKQNKCLMLGGLLLNKACALHELGRDDESKVTLIDSYYACRLMKNDEDCEIVRKYAWDTFGLEFNN